MHRFRVVTPLIWILCVAFLAARAGGAHLHLCLDGLEAPVTVHVEGHAGQHEAEEVGTSHNDVDVPIVAEALAKSSKALADPEGLALLALSLFFPLVRSPSRVRPARARALVPFSPPRHFLPPAHAPPR
ncbi:MAG: hypothetical protein R3E69_15270 [Steroidobacteraceae bacterium]